MMDADSLLGPSDPACFSVERASGRSPFLLTCDHAGNLLPRRLGSLGLSDQELTTHVAWDLGIAELGRQLSRRLDAFMIAQSYSRLVIDVNRPPGTPESIVTLSEHTEVPGNRSLTPRDIAQRTAEVFAPYHLRITEELDARARQGRDTVLVALHSFTPRFKSVDRRVQVGVLYGRDDRVAKPLLACLRRDGYLEVGDNEPYAVSDDTDYTVVTHGERRGTPHVELEFRQDLLASEAACAEWAERMASLLESLLPELFPTRYV